MERSISPELRFVEAGTAAIEKATNASTVNSRLIRRRSCTLPPRGSAGEFHPLILLVIIVNCSCARNRRELVLRPPVRSKHKLRSERYLTVSSTEYFRVQ